MDIINGAIAAWNRRTAVWVPVEEKLPTEDKHVLVALLCGSVGVGQHMRYAERWVVFLPTTMDEEDRITHWTPLPEPPEGVE
jgi:hypothetical protein